MSTDLVITPMDSEYYMSREYKKILGNLVLVSFNYILFHYGLLENSPHSLGVSLHDWMLLEYRVGGMMKCIVISYLTQGKDGVYMEGIHSTSN